ncbi:hypothetical protein RCL1_000179 [Eukaryota sp. TZLM3-RCL]
MSDRKPVNKYIPADFDPSKIPRGRRSGSANSVRFMLPMSVRCEKCGDHMYVGTKFNARKELVWDQDYLGIKIFRFFMSCRLCSNEMVLKTDPKNADYICECGVVRAYEPWREKERQEKLQKELLEKKEELDGTAAIQHKSEKTRQEMDDFDRLDFLKRLSTKQHKISHNKLLEMVHREDVDHSLDDSLSSIDEYEGDVITVGGDAVEDIHVMPEPPYKQVHLVSYSSDED